MADDNVTQLPVGDVDFDLDNLEKPAEDVRPVFAAAIGGKRIEFLNPEDLDWQTLMDIESPVDFIQYVTSRDDLKHIRSQTVPGWKLGKLMEAFHQHYGIDKKIEDAQREQRQAARRGR